MKINERFAAGLVPLMLGMSRSALLRAALVTGSAIAVSPGTVFCAPRTIRPATLAPSVDLVNPMAGLYRWYGRETVRPPHPSYDSYRRFTWRELERAANRYTFEPIEQEAVAARRRHAKFGFRVMSAYAGQGVVVPDDLARALPRGFHFASSGAKTDTYVPDWNDPRYLDRVKALASALAERYDGDPRIGWVDIGTYGNWGEWHVAGFPYPAPSGAVIGSVATKHAIVDAWFHAFKRTRLVMLTDDDIGLEYAMSLSPRIGLRRDSLGSHQFDDELREPPQKYDALKDRWKTAPFIAEHYGLSPDIGDFDASFAQLAAQVRRNHVALIANGNLVEEGHTLPPRWAALLRAAGRASGFRFTLRSVAIPERLSAGSRFLLVSTWTNEGCTPAYEPWQVDYELRESADRAPVASWTSSLNLQKLLPTEREQRIVDSFSLAHVAHGHYTLYAVVRDQAGYRVPMELANRDRLSNGSYRIGPVTIIA